MKSSESVANIIPAIIRANNKIKAVKFDSTNPYYKSKYASLGAVIDAVKAEYLQEKMTVIQMPGSSPEPGTNKVGITNIVMHESGEWIEQDIFMEIPSESKKPAEAAGIIISYLRRYSLASIAGMYAEEDTDGRVDNNQPKSNQQKNTRQNPNESYQNEPKAGSIAEAPKTAKIQSPEQSVTTNNLPLAEAEAIISKSTGKTYGEHTDAELSHKLAGLNKLINAEPNDSIKITEYMRKRAAIVTILNARLKQ